MPVEMKCLNCEQPFYCYQSEVDAGRKYCSIACRGKHLHKKENAASRTPVGFTCKECSKPFTMMQSYLDAYRKKFGKDPLYCSMDCSNTGRRRDADERNKFTCQHCGKLEIRSRYTDKFRIYRDQKYCSHECKVAAQTQSAFDRFNAGDFSRHVKRHGYVYISVPSLANGGKRTEKLEHRHVMEQHLGRALHPNETVHHRDGNRAHNELSNLELFSSRHGPGQRVVDKVQFAIDMLTLYPEFARAVGYELRAVEQVMPPSQSDRLTPHLGTQDSR